MARLVNQPSAERPPRAGAVILPASLPSRREKRPAAPLDNRYPRILNMLEPPEREQLLACATDKQVKKGQFFYHQGDMSDALFIIMSGTVKVLYINDVGSALTALYYREGMVVGAHGCTAWSGRWRIPAGHYFDASSATRF